MWNHPIIQELSRIIKIVQKHLPPSYDRESIAMDIMVESIMNNTPSPSPTFIRNRCVDAYRRRTAEQKALTKVRPPSTENHAMAVERRDSVERLTRTLSHYERRVIYLRFYEDMTIQEIAKELSIAPKRVSELLMLASVRLQQEALNA